ncbi:MAG: glycogen phosphorylase [Candidatus Hydrogenedentota bacterium]
MAKVTRFTVVPKLPPALERLRDIANNLWWCSDPEAIELFFRMDRDLWIKTGQNPVAMLGEVGQAALERLAADDSFLSHLKRVSVRMDEYLNSSPWAERNTQSPKDLSIAYLSAEFGLHESVSVYSGGLGVLAGDHLKSASDLGLPLVGVGLLYREGYHRQYLNADGWQQERYPKNDVHKMPVELVRDKKGKPIVVKIAYPERTVHVRAWQLKVGRVPLYLLDSDFEQNDAEDREITARLYGGDRDMRIRQEILLGMASVRLLRALNIYPTVFHMNEGHAAFMTLERIRELMSNDKLTFEQALESVKSASVFTTHTPVPAGNDMFPPEMIEHYFKAYCSEIGIELGRLLGLGRQDPGDVREPFCMTVLALKISCAANGVAKLHGEISRSMWSRTWKDVPVDEVPITSITNGVHPRFWISRDMGGLYDTYLGPSWISNPPDQEVWDRIDAVPDAELWRTHERRRERLVNFVRRRLVQQLKDRGSSNADVQAANEVLDPEVLTIGFARRFATYKRANLFIMDPERLVRILKKEAMPVQFIISGKAHPQDNAGKELIRNIIQFVRRYNTRNHIVFIEDYDINVARYMVQGVDCWLNTPRRPMEASGTSGMKAALNGALNISIPDGWWDEAALLGENGWTIGRGENYENTDEQDHVEGEMLYELLELEIAPAFYDRGRDGLPRHWIRRMKNAIRTCAPFFNTHRMVQEYADRFYIPATVRRNELRADNRKRAKALSDWKSRVVTAWGNVTIANLESGNTEDLIFGSKLDVTADISLAGLTENDVAVEVYYGDVDSLGQIVKGAAVPMQMESKLEGTLYRFKGSIPCGKTGEQGFTVRAIPRHTDLMNPHETQLIVWA